MVDLAAVVFSESCARTHACATAACPPPACQPLRCRARHRCLTSTHAKPMLCHCAAGREGQVLDVVHVHKHMALMGALCSSQDRSMWPENATAVPGDDVVHVFPKKLDPAAEVRGARMPARVWPFASMCACACM